MHEKPCLSARVRVYLHTLYTRAYVAVWGACACLSEGPITYVLKYICHGRVTALTLASEAMPGHCLPATMWEALALRA